MKSLFVVIGLLSTITAYATPANLKLMKGFYPKATGLTCKICHEGSMPGLNAYGLDLYTASILLLKEKPKGLDFKAIETRDSDKDGVDNITEINKGTNPGIKE